MTCTGYCKQCGRDCGEAISKAYEQGCLDQMNVAQQYYDKKIASLQSQHIEELKKLQPDGPMWKRLHEQQEYIGSLQSCLADHYEVYDALLEEQKKSEELEQRLSECVEAIEGIISVADRKTAEFDRARDCLARVKALTQEGNSEEGGENG